MALKRNLVANYLGQAWTTLIGLAFIPLYIKFLGIESYALIGLFAVMTAWLNLLDMGMSPAISREMARFTGGQHTPFSIRQLLRSMELVILAIGLTVIGFISALAPWIASGWLRIDRLPVDLVTQAITLSGCVVGLRFCEGIYRNAIIGLQHQVWYNAANTVLQTLRHAGVVGVLAWISPTISAFFIWQAAISIISLITFRLKLDGSLPSVTDRPKISLNSLKTVWKFAGSMLAINTLSIFSTQIDKVLLSKIITLESFGYYTLAGVIGSIIWMIAGPVMQVVYPKLTQLHSTNNELDFSHLFHKGAQLVTLLCTPVVTVLALYPEQAIFVWTGNAVLATNTAPILVPIIIGYFTNSLTWAPYHAQLAYGWTNLTLMTGIASVVIMVPAIIIAVPIYGPIGAAYIWLLANIFSIIISVNIMFMKILKGERLNWFWEDVARPIATSSVVSFAIYLVVPLDKILNRSCLGLYLIIFGIGVFLVILAQSILLRRLLMSIIVEFKSRGNASLRKI